jgi:hypothetical protein
MSGLTCSTVLIEMIFCDDLLRAKQTLLHMSLTVEHSRRR